MELLSRTDLIILCSIILTGISALGTWVAITLVKSNKKDK